MPSCAAFSAGQGRASSSSSEASGLDIDGLSTEDAKEKVLSWLESKSVGERKTNYKLRDWLFARQRYWGEPFPVSFPEGSTVRLPEAVRGSLSKTLERIEDAFGETTHTYEMYCTGLSRLLCTILMCTRCEGTPREEQGSAT